MNKSLFFLGFILGLFAGIIWQYNAFKPHIASIKTCTDYILTNPFLRAEITDMCKDMMFNDFLPKDRGEAKYLVIENKLYKIRKLKD